MTGDEREVLHGLLDYQRATVVWKGSGLSPEQALQSHVPSELTTVAGLLVHLTLVENYWFSIVLDGQEDAWDDILKDDPDAEFRVKPGTPVDGLIADYEAECARSREIVAKRAFDDEVDYKGDRRVNVRWVVAHMVEETARHAGHLDLLRELTDGLTGE